MEECSPLLGFPASKAQHESYQNNSEIIMHPVPTDNVGTFEQHDDTDVIIPDAISFVLVISAHLFAIMAVLCFVYGVYILGALSTALYLTSIWHWHKPRFSSLARRVDYCAVLAVVAYASYYATTEATVYEIIWFAGFAVLSVIFVVNEYRYYCQAMKTPLGLDAVATLEDGCIIRKVDDEFGWLSPTRPNTPERDYVYKRTVYTHCVGVHCLGFCLACVIIVSSHYYPEA
jgi:hypothetical protein